MSVYFLSIENVASNIKDNSPVQELYHILGRHLSPKMVITMTPIYPFLNLSPVKYVYFSEKQTHQKKQVEKCQKERTTNLKIYFLFLFRTYTRRK